MFNWNCSRRRRRETEGEWEMSLWKCFACGDAENCDIHCTLEIEVGEPETCPVSGDECEWTEVENLETLAEKTAITGDKDIIADSKAADMARRLEFRTIDPKDKDYQEKPK